MQTNIFMVVGALLAVLPSLVLAQRLLQPTYSEDTVPSAHHDSLPLSSDYSTKKWKLKKATQDWAQAEKRHRLHQQAFDGPGDYAPAASNHRRGSGEQDTSESFVGGGGPSWGGADESSHDGSRIHFHVQGHKGPKSYRFGYDTGKGAHRHFRYEERDEHGVVHGRYGYHDKHGELHVFHYTAHPHHGYRAHKAHSHHYG